MNWFGWVWWGEWFEAEDFKVVVLGARGGDVGGACMLDLYFSASKHIKRDLIKESRESHNIRQEINLIDNKNYTLW